MRETGIVTDVMDGEIKIKISRVSSCGENCTACGGCKNKEHYIVASNDIGAKKGDSVIVQMSAESILKASFIAYIIPLIMIVLGYYAGMFLTDNEGVSALIGFLFMAVTFTVLHLYDKKVSEKYKPVVLSTINEKEK